LSGGEIEWSKLRWPFYSSGGWESSCPGRVAGSSSVDSMLRFRFERGGDGTKRCWKMKRRQQAHLRSMERKCDMAQRRQPEERWHRGGEREEMTPIGLT
jgi:hypothetical protein